MFILSYGVCIYDHLSKVDEIRSKNVEMKPILKIEIRLELGTYRNMEVDFCIRLNQRVKLVNMSLVQRKKYQDSRFGKRNTYQI